MPIYLYALSMALISAIAFGAHVYIVGMLALFCGMIGVFIYKNQNHPAVLEWMEKYF